MVEPDSAEASAEAVSSSGREAEPRSVLRRYGLTAWDGVVSVLVLLLTLVYFPPFFFQSWTPRFVLVLTVAPVGLVLLVQRCRNRDRYSLALAAALAWSVVSGIMSGAPRSALLGFAGRDLSVLTVVGAASFWEVGRMASQRGREVATYVFVVSCAAGALVGVAQVLGSVDSGPLAMLSGRPTGLVTNPVYYGALSASGAVAAAALWGAGTRRVTGPCLVALGVATTLSGSRVALIAAVLSGVALVAVHRTASRAVGVGLLTAALAAGVVLDRVAGAGRNAADRIAADGAGGGRISVWGYGFDAFLDRPILGHGFGQFRPAVQGRFSASFVRDNAPDELTQAWFDPHNVGVLVLVSVGVVGLLLFLAWAGLWAWHCRGPLVWALVALLLHWMLQPVSLFTLPLAMLLFGLAGHPRPREPLSSPPMLWGIAACVGVALAGSVVANDLRLAGAVSDLDAPRAASIAGWFPRDPIVADVVARVSAVEVDPGVEDAELEWRRRAADYEPDRPLWWSSLAEAQLDRGLDEEAERSIRRALQLQPYNLRSQRVEVLLALRARDVVRLDAALQLACELGQSDCGLDATELIDQLPPEE